MSDEESLRRHSVKELTIIINSCRAGGNVKLLNLAEKVLTEKEESGQPPEKKNFDFSNCKSRPLWA